MGSFISFEDGEFFALQGSPKGSRIPKVLTECCVAWRLLLVYSSSDGSHSPTLSSPRRLLQAASPGSAAVRRFEKRREDAVKKKDAEGHVDNNPVSGRAIENIKANVTRGTPKP